MIIASLYPGDWQVCSSAPSENMRGALARFEYATDRELRLSKPAACPEPFLSLSCWSVDAANCRNKFDVKTDYLNRANWISKFGLVLKSCISNASFCTFLPRLFNFFLLLFLFSFYYFHVIASGGRVILSLKSLGNGLLFPEFQVVFDH